ncbi:DUF6643 family protein [Kitasatospora sp. NPDC089913]|uniref:DUF6643 family protein n=1 Tax=Kitasatospora sp. NPDC089913 TaxID=3364080 RepID=UPI00087CEA76|nr:hypothetical protein SAMN05216371_1653 [Streptomyces sp. TLI_053]
MTSPRSYDGVGYPSPSFSSGTPIYDSLVAERGVPQIAPINVPAALPPALSTGYGSGLPGQSYENRYGSGYDSPGGNLPALPPARLALGPGPSSAPSGPATTYIPAQPAPAYAAAPQPAVPGYGAPQPYLPGQRPQVPTPGFTQASTGGYQPSGGQSFGGQNTFVGGNGGQQTFGAQPAGPHGTAGQPQGGPQSFGGQQSFGGPQGFGGQGGHQGGFGGSADQSFGGAQLRPAVTPVAPVRPMQPQRPGPYGEHGQYQQGYQPQAQGY